MPEKGAAPSPPPPLDHSTPAQTLRPLQRRCALAAAAQLELRRERLLLQLWKQRKALEAHAAARGAPSSRSPPSTGGQGPPWPDLWRSGEALASVKAAEEEDAEEEDAEEEAADVVMEGEGAGGAEGDAGAAEAAEAGDDEPGEVEEADTAREDDDQSQAEGN